MRERDLLLGDGMFARRELSLAAISILVLVSCAPPPSPTISRTAQATAELSVRPLVQGRDWEILGDVVNSGPEGIDVATSEAEFESTWQRYKPGTNPPRVDLSRNLFLFLQVIVPVDCPDLTITGLVFDPSQSLLYGEYEDPVPSGACSDAAGSHTFIVSVDRGQLAGGRVRIRVMRDFQLCEDCGREVEQTEVDLR